MISTRALLASVAVLQGDIARARTLLAGLLSSEYPEGQEQVPLRRCWSADAELELAQGHPRRALGIVDRLLAATPNLAEYGPQAVPYLSRLRGQALAALASLGWKISIPFPELPATMRSAAVVSLKRTSERRYALNGPSALIYLDNVGMNRSRLPSGLLPSFIDYLCPVRQGDIVPRRANDQFAMGEFDDSVEVAAD